MMHRFTCSALDVHVWLDPKSLLKFTCALLLLARLLLACSRALVRAAGGAQLGRLGALARAVDLEAHLGEDAADALLPALEAAVAQVCGRRLAAAAVWPPSGRCSSADAGRRPAP